MTTRPLPSPATPGRLPRRRRRITPSRLLRPVETTLAVIGAIAIVLLLLGVLDVHAVTEHLSVH
jgi:hypothetical protein